MSPYVIYARKSTESEDRQVLSIDSQVKELRSLAERQGVAVAEVLTESRSAKAPGRPIFGDLMKRVERGAVRGIVCWKLDRLARNHLDHGRVLQALSAGVLERVVTPERTYTGDGNDRFMGNFELGMATKFIDDLRANVKRGNRARFEQGWPNFMPPLGYLNDPATRTIVKDPVRFALVRRMWDLLLTGTMNPGAIRKIANKQWKFRTRTFKRSGGKPLGHSQVYKIFGNPFYMGVIQLRDGRTYPGSHPAMITRDEFHRAQEILGRPSRSRPEKHAFPYTGLITCGHCGGQVTAEVHVKSSGKSYAYYHCTHQKTGKPCREPMISSRALEDQFGAMLGRLTMPEPVLAWLLKQAHRRIVGEEQRKEQILAAQKAALESYRRQERRLLDLHLREQITSEVFEDKRRELDSNRKDVEEKLAAGSRQKSDEETAQTIAKVISFGAEAQRTFHSGTSVQRRMILEAVASNYQLRQRKVSFQLEQPFKILSEANGNFNWCATVDAIRTWLLDSSMEYWIPDLQSSTVKNSLQHFDQAP